MITLDTTRADHIGAYGAEDARTPVLDALAAESVLFENAVSPIPLTLPSHATMFTALDPPRHGVRYNGSYVLADEHVTLAERMREAGFRTGAVASAFPVAERFGLGQGFESYEDLFEIREGVQMGDQKERSAEEALGLGQAWWDENEEDRRFLWIHLYDPHHRYAPPFPFSSEFEDRPYAGEIAYVDHELGKLFDHLKARGEWERTLVVVVADHGESLYEHGERWHGDLVYEGAIHVPFLIKPAGPARSRRVADPVGVVDVAPTILEVLQLPPLGPDLDGISLAPALTGERPPIRPIYFESMSCRIHYGWAGLRGIRVADYKLIEGARPELYDVSVDRAEVDDLAGRDEQRLNDMTSTLHAIAEKAGEQDSAGDETAMMDAETLAALASLGYVGSGGADLSETSEGLHPPDAVDLLQELLRAQGALAQLEWDAAGEMLDFILRRDPRNRFALHQRARVFFRQGKLDEALLAIEAAGRLYPDAAMTRDLQGKILVGLGRVEEALDVYDAAIRDKPEHKMLRYHRVLTLAEGGRAGEGEADAGWLVEHHPEDRTSWVALAIVRAQQGRPEAALDALGRAVDAGLHTLLPAENSAWFDAVRSLPAYADLAERVEELKEN